MGKIDRRHHTIAIKQDGTFWVCGINNKGESGNSTTTDKLDPSQIGLNHDWKEVSTDYEHNLAIKQNGKIWGWGANLESSHEKRTYNSSLATFGFFSDCHLSNLYCITTQKMSQQNINYNRIADAIEYIRTNFKEQPSLDEIARKIHLSPFHFQRLFSDWAGTTPKKFLQFTTIEYAKTLLKENQATLFETAHEIGLSGTGRLHDLFINIEGMTPAEYKNGAKNLIINYSFAASPFGDILVASTEKGICYMAFIDDETSAFHKLQDYFPNAHLKQKIVPIQQNALCIFTQDWTELNKIKLHLKGTDFQLKVWQTLLKIPMGQLTTYGAIANKIGNPHAFRAVGTAIGSNPVAFLIPCHRVIQSSGMFGGYMWGNIRKTAIIGWEGIKTQHI